MSKLQKHINKVCRNRAKRPAWMKRVSYFAGPGK